MEWGLDFWGPDRSSHSPPLRAGPARRPPASHLLSALTQELVDGHASMLGDDNEAALDGPRWPRPPRLALPQLQWEAAMAARERSTRGSMDEKEKREMMSH